MIKPNKIIATFVHTNKKLSVNKSEFKYLVCSICYENLDITKEIINDILETKMNCLNEENLFIIFVDDDLFNDLVSKLYISEDKKRIILVYGTN
jgi:hypothetical protein